MKASGIGGQAVMEGVMMRNRDRYAVAVRKPDQEIIIDKKEWHSISERYPFLALPFIRGSVNLIESMIVGMRTLTYSANFIETEEDAEKAKKSEKELQAEESAQEKPKKKEEEGLSPMMTFLTILFSLALSIALFVFLPLAISDFVLGVTKITSAFLSSLIEGLIRIVIFILYVALIGLMPEIKRVFRYHGAEHKTINCIEHGLPLTVENARKSSKEHKRCGTSFMIIVMVISILFFSIINLIPFYTGSSRILKTLVRFLVRILLLPIVAGLSYEFLRLAGRSESRWVDLLSRPGMWMQALTTKEPDDGMLEVAIASVEAVFDWKAFQAGEAPENCRPAECDKEAE